MEVEILNIIYNACDVGVNTCKGEGHGLVNHEHAACGVAQIVPNHTSCKEIFEGTGELIRCDFIDIDMNFNREMPMPSAEHLAEILGKYYEDRELLAQVADRCYLRATDDKYQWDTIAGQFDELFQEALKDPEPAKVKRPRKKAKAKQLVEA